MPSLPHLTLQRLKDLSEASGHQRLPSIRDLAARWSVSPRTVQLAVQEAVIQGWLETRHGSGIWPKGSLPHPKPPPPKMDSHRIADRIGTEIISGQFASDQLLPSVKDYSKSFDVHPSTIRKALGYLQAQGLLDREGRSWTASKPKSSGSHPHAPVLLCLGAVEEDGNLRVDSDREWDFWREIQLEALRCGLEPKIVPIGSKPPELDVSVFGAIVSNWHMSDSEPLLDKLQRLRIPTAFWVANEESLPGTRYKDARGIWFHDLANGRSAGRTMADFINNSGHRKIAWISPFHGSTWSRNRLDGLKSRIDPDVEVFEATHDWISEWDVKVRIAWTPELTRRFDLEGVDASVDPDSLRRPLVDTLTRMRCVDVLQPRLDQALRSKATLWIAASDLVAEWCLYWLRSRGLHCPRDLALASFDDTRDATRRNLTSLRFDVTGMARAMVRQVLSSRREHKVVTRYTGIVVARESTRRVG